MSIAPNTRRNYSASVEAYKAFCLSHTLVPFPPTEQILILFSTHLATFSSHSNVKLHMAAIKHHSIVLGQNVLFRDFDRLYLVIRGIKRTQGRSHSLPKRLPITPSLLRIINQNLFNSSRLFEDKIMLWAALTTAFFGFLRISEYTTFRKTKFDQATTLMLTDVRIRNDSVRLHLKTSKTDPFRQGVTVRIQANNTFLCPVNALRHYIASHPNPRGPLHFQKWILPNEIRYQCSPEKHNQWCSKCILAFPTHRRSVYCCSNGMPKISDTKYGPLVK